MPPIQLTEREIGDYGALVGHMEISRDEHGRLRFTCPRCRLVWGEAIERDARWACDELIAHLAKHGVEFGAARRGHPGRGRPAIRRGRGAAENPSQRELPVEWNVWRSEVPPRSRKR